MGARCSDSGGPLLQRVDDDSCQLVASNHVPSPVRAEAPRLFPFTRNITKCRSNNPTHKKANVEVAAAAPQAQKVTPDVTRRVAPATTFMKNSWILSGFACDRGSGTASCSRAAAFACLPLMLAMGRQFLVHPTTRRALSPRKKPDSCCRHPRRPLDAKHFIRPRPHNPTRPTCRRRLIARSQRLVTGELNPLRAINARCSPCCIRWSAALCCWAGADATVALLKEWKGRGGRSVVWFDREWRRRRWCRRCSARSE